MNKLSKLIGAVLLIVGTVAIWYWPSASAPEPPPDMVRPVRSVVIQDGQAMPDFKFNGIVRAYEDRELAFKQEGRIERIFVKKGQLVKRGEKLASLVQTDFVNRLAAMEAAAERDRLTYQRISEAAKKNAVSREEVSKAQSNLKQAESALALARTALDDTVLYAPFAGVVADVPAGGVDVAGVGRTIVYLLDLSKVKVEATVPETLVILNKRIKSAKDISPLVTFDSVEAPGIPAAFVEYKANAEDRNQTFTAIYELTVPPDLTILPGMSATVNVPGADLQMDGSETAVRVPSSAIGVEADGSYFVWKLTAAKANDGTFEVHRCRLQECLPIAGMMQVKGELRPGDRIATAGVSLLTEGRRVTLLKETGGAK